MQLNNTGHLKVFFGGCRYFHGRTIRVSSCCTGLGDEAESQLTYLHSPISVFELVFYFYFIAKGEKLNIQPIQPP